MPNTFKNLSCHSYQPSALQMPEDSYLRLLSSQKLLLAPIHSRMRCSGSVIVCQLCSTSCLRRRLWLQPHLKKPHSCSLTACRPLNSCSKTWTALPRLLLTSSITTSAPMLALPVLCSSACPARTTSSMFFNLRSDLDCTDSTNGPPIPTLLRCCTVPRATFSGCKETSASS